MPAAAPLVTLAYRADDPEGHRWMFARVEPGHRG
jgi:hypothetical protein